jgi:hypothetical protein
MATIAALLRDLWLRQLAGTCRPPLQELLLLPIWF